MEDDPPSADAGWLGSDGSALVSFFAFFFLDGPAALSPGGAEPESSAEASSPVLLFFLRERTLPSCLATRRAYRSPHCKTRKRRTDSQTTARRTISTSAALTALQRSFSPLSPFLHSGLSLSPQLWHSLTPFGGLPPFLSCVESFGTPEALRLPPPDPPRWVFFGRTSGTPGANGSGVLRFFGGGDSSLDPVGEVDTNRSCVYPSVVGAVGGWTYA